MTSLLDIPSRTTDPRFPFWHRQEPVVAVTEIDGKHAELRTLLGDATEDALALKALFDSITALRATDAVRPDVQAELVRELAEAAARGCESLGSQCTDTAPALANRSTQYARALREFGTTGTWPQLELASPRSGEPWLYCGPLTSWAVRPEPQPLSLLVVVADTLRQSVVDVVDERWHLGTAAIEQALAQRVDSCPSRPGMCAARLLLAGGDAARGHKHFAHFVPLEMPGVRDGNDEFTVTFTNVHEARLRRCSLPLLASVGVQPRDDYGAVFDASLTWFRCHDLSHFLRLSDPDMADGPPSTVPNPPTGTAFDGMALEELYADSLGFIGAAGTLPATSRQALCSAFAAELLRYLSRNPENFADSAAATLEYGWLREKGIDIMGLEHTWIDDVILALAELAGAAHAILWGPGPEPRAEATVQLAAARGKTEREKLHKYFATIPTDLSYTF